MTRPRTGRPPGRPKSDRTTDDHAYVRMTSEERKTIERSIDLQMRDAQSGVRITVSGMMLDAALREAVGRLAKEEVPLLYKEGEYFESDDLCTKLGLTSALKYKVLSALRDMATREEVVVQHAATTFVRPKTK